MFAALCKPRNFISRLSSYGSGSLRSSSPNKLVRRGETCCVTSYILLASKELLFVVFFSFGDSLLSSYPNKKLVRRAMDFALKKIDKYVDNHTSLDQRMKDLKRKLEQLNGLKEDAESIMTTELQPRKKPKAEVQIWFKNVERIKGEVQDLDGRIGESNVLTRGFHAEDASRKIKEVEELINQRRQFHGGLVVDNPQWIGQVLSTTSLSGEAVKACVEEIWQCLMDDEVGKIGVWGMGGVGKTSLMKLINNQLLKETEKFDIVIWVTVSKEMSIAKLQRDIASKIEVVFSDDEDETTRAGKLFETLSQKSRFVMILDDLWEKISLETMGIPEPSVGSKLMLTTRSYDVCRQMCCRVIRVKPLTKEEAWKLFLEKVGRDILNIPGVEPIARSIAKRCAGLPLGLITIASCMRGINNICEWRNALTELSLHKTSVNGLKDEVFQQLRFSYDRLKDGKLQDCFLTCALYPEDWEIREEELIQLWIAEGVMEEVDNIQAKLDRGRAIMNRLTRNCLLEVFTERENERRVKMHDLLRDMALDIAGSRFLVKSGMMLEKAPDVQDWDKDLEKVSLMRNWRLYIPSEMTPPKCPILTTLLLSGCGIDSIPEGFFTHMHGLRFLDLSGNPIESLPHSFSKCTRLTTLLLFYCKIVSIPEGFFNHMDGLEVLDLSGNPIKSLPHSLSNLKNLTSLWLAYCVNLENVPSLSNLRVLKLDLGGTHIKKIPQGMENLVSLVHLNLGDCYNLKEIPNGILSRLCCLQQLRVGETLISGKEVGGLKKLEVLEGRFEDWDNLNMYLQGFHGREEPPQYRISVGDVEWDVRSWNKEGKVIGVRGCEIHTYQMMLPPDIEELEIHNCDLDCSEEYPLFSRSILSSLSSFSSLKSFSIYGCRNMKKLFSPNCVPLNLEELSVSNCEQLEEIITSEVEQEGRGGMEFRLPQLRRLQLFGLPELKRIHALLVCDSLVQISIVNCVKLERIGLNLPPPAPDSVSIRIWPREWWESVEWDAKPLLKPIFFEVHYSSIVRFGLRTTKFLNSQPHH
ncbi:hypothetical protein V6N12_024763 [Hibiscus sabdariffa]|uniref:Uncharacterized protein n=1 Tax=Hibiscus sabdariffa TaxID=183260 RepID=A0ABR2B9D4_9ROSI